MSCDDNLREMVNTFSMITPDGQPVRWALNLLHRTSLKDRVYGPELMLRLCRRAAKERLPVYLYGGSESVSTDLVAAIQRQFPDLAIAGAESPPFRPLTNEEDEQVVDRINASGAPSGFHRIGMPQTGLVCSRTSESSQGSANLRWRCIRLSCRCQTDGTALDAAQRHGVVVSVIQGTRPTLETISRYKHSIRFESNESTCVQNQLEHLGKVSG